MSVVIKNLDQIEGMRLAGRLASEVLDYITPYVNPGISTGDLDRLCYEYMVNVQGTYPAPLNYCPRGFTPYPKSICTSVNHQICHGIPSEKKILKHGDIINIDVTVIKNGFHGDTSRMFLVGKTKPVAQRLCNITFKAMWAGITQVKPGATLGDIGWAIQQVAEQNGYSIVREYCGHGIGEVFHEAPQILHFGNQSEGMKLEPGMIFTIEPMLNAGKHHTRVLADGWTVVTADHSLSAQWEHTVLVTDVGYEVLTLSEGALPCPNF